MDFSQEEIKEIYSHIGNAESKRIFTDRFMYNITDDVHFIKNIVRDTNEGREFLDRLQNCKKKLIFGAGIPIISFQEFLDKYKNEIIIISSCLYHIEIYQHLKENGIKEENIINAGKMTDTMSKRQYFDIPQLNNKSEGEGCFVDAGSFDGRTSKIFAEWCGGNFQKIFAIEPDDKNAIKCEKTLQNCGGKIV